MKKLYIILKKKNIKLIYAIQASPFNITRLIKRNNNTYSNEIPEENYFDNIK